MSALFAQSIGALGLLLITGGVLRKDGNPTKYLLPVWGSRITSL